MSKYEHDVIRKRRHTTAGASENIEPISSKHACVFLCLFDGFRIPSIRRLTRKPRTICFEPLFNYNPSLFSPATKVTINGRYQSMFNISCESIIDPSINEVVGAVSKSLSRPANERLIFHYFGQGSIPPSKSGFIFFFDQEHSTYKGMSLQHAIGGASKAPFVLIIDVNSAGALLPEISRISEQKGGNLIAFLSCDDGETLPSAPSLPFDILSSSILFPVETAVWFHSSRCLSNDSFYFEKVAAASSFTSSENNSKTGIIQELLKDNSFTSFLEAVIDSIAFSKLDQTTSEKYLFEDKALAAITRGFILAQRILRFYNVHAKSFPFLADFSDSELWGFLDLALDSVFSQGSSVLPAFPDVFEQLMVSFTNFPLPSVLPIVCHFLNISYYSHRIEAMLLHYIDNFAVQPITHSSAHHHGNHNSSRHCMNSLRGNSGTNYECVLPIPLSGLVVRSLLNRFSVESFLATAKLAFFNGLNQNDTATLFGIITSPLLEFKSESDICHLSFLNKESSDLSTLSTHEKTKTNTIRSSSLNSLSNPTLLGAAMFAGVCCIAHDNFAASIISSPNVVKTCVNNAQQAAPYSALLFGVIASRSPAFKADDESIDTFSLLLLSAKEDIRVSAAYALGGTKSIRALPELQKGLEEESEDSEIVLQELIAASHSVISNVILAKSYRHVQPNNEENEEDKIENEEVSILKEFKESITQLHFENDELNNELKAVEELIDHYFGNDEENQKKENDVSFVIGKGRRAPQRITTRIPTLLKQTMEKPGIMERYSTNLFDMQTNLNTKHFNI
ncbi:hypothetical protein TRFO_12644 [Tritrichomonas foetus]|uniref:Raptor N-terminal CASPase-like domain-containing protein n=1 Tax=Tritrichomonas foetus TaxID=1144522 RepID=A0A1J4L0R9_9EUKA|nr:hypothetical protein TRFO_12644 [Tritrichomonas foetus]|eukprot:OHT17121.1 hypothetical protein TRFO_12644 [Tritrichomonas foetus]